MTDFLLELRSEEIPARMQALARFNLQQEFSDALHKRGLTVADHRIETFTTPRRLILIARDLPDATEGVSEERKGPRATAPEAALAGFLRSTGLTREQLVERDGVFFAVVAKPGRATADVLAEAIPALIRAFPWPKSMRWGTASASPQSLRWVRPLSGIVALFGTEIVPVEIDGIAASATTLGHRFHHPGPITIGGAHDYVEKLRACHVIVDHAEREAIVRELARAAAITAGLVLVEDEGLVVENAALTEWPVPLLGRFDAAYLGVPREVIQLTMRTNQKYFACVGADGALANAFVCTANIDAVDGGAAVVAGNERVLSARLADAKFFWDADLKVPLAEQAAKLKDIVFHEKLGTVADKVERVAKLARWLCEEGIVTEARFFERSRRAQPGSSEVENPIEANDALAEKSLDFARHSPSTSLGEAGLGERAALAATLCKADLVTGMVGEFPELQGIVGGHLARAQGLGDDIADAIRDHYKPVGQGDDVPTAPVTVAVALADKLDTVSAFWVAAIFPTGSKDPFALRRAVLGTIEIGLQNLPTFSLNAILREASSSVSLILAEAEVKSDAQFVQKTFDNSQRIVDAANRENRELGATETRDASDEFIAGWVGRVARRKIDTALETLLPFFADRLKVQQREAGVRHDLIDAVFVFGGEDDLVRLLARVRALQGFVGTGEGAALLGGYKRAANILKKEGFPPSPSRGEGQASAASQGEGLGLSGEPSAPRPGAVAPVPLPFREREEDALIAALDAAEPLAAAAVAREDFEGAMTALATLRGPIDAFFEQVTVNDADPDTRAARLALLERVRTAVHRVADFSKIEG